MVCMHLIKLEKELKQKGITETFRGKAWSQNCREWVYYNCCFDLEYVSKRMDFDPCVETHIHLGTHDGAEAGFVCALCKDGIMGNHHTIILGISINSISIL